MPLLIPLIILATLFPAYNVVKNKIIVKPTPKIERIQNYTMNQLNLSTLTEKYGIYDYPSDTTIDFNNCKYKVIDNKSGGRKFEPLYNCPPLILTPIPYEKYLTFLSPTPTNTQNLTNTNQNSFKENHTNNFRNNSVNNSNYLESTSAGPRNSDYIRCHFPHSGILILKKEECERLIDCQINDALWTPLTREECERRQKDYVNQKVEELIKLRQFSNQNQNFDSVSTTIPTPALNLEFFSNETNSNNNSSIEPSLPQKKELTDEEKIACKDRISSYYRDLIKKMLAGFRGRNIPHSSYAIQKEKELLNEMNNKIRSECGYENN